MGLRRWRYLVWANIAHTGRTLKWVARRSTAFPTIMFCSVSAMTNVNNAKRNIYFSKPQNKRGVISVEFNLDVKPMVQRHVRSLVLRVSRDSTLTHLHRLYFFCQG